MIIKSIQIKDADISIAFQKPSTTGFIDVLTLKSKDDPRPEFLDKFQIPFLVNTFKFKCDAYDEDIVDKVSVEGTVGDENTHNSFKFKTDWLNVEYADATFTISVQNLIEECVKFIMGKRAQDSLFIDEE